MRPSRCLCMPLRCRSTDLTFGDLRPCSSQVPSIRTAKMNQSQNIFESAPVQPPPSQYTGRKNYSHHVTNLTPKAPDRITSRTARVNSESSEEAKMKQTNRTSKANEQTTAEDDKPICLERHAVHNLMMAGSDIFSTTSSEQAAPPKTRRMIQAPGGASSNIFS